jgi:putative acetyltransferase
MSADIIIRPIRSSEIKWAKKVIIAGCREIFETEPADFGDMENLSGYSPPGGIFLVLVDRGTIVGTGAVRAIDPHVCELKRMWLLPDYRGKGLGRRLAELLIDFARAAGYRRMLLDTDPRQTAALRLYQKLGFHPIDRYNDGPCSIFMEKIFT